MRNSILAILAFAGSGLIWLPLAIEPHLDFPPWLPDADIALVIFLTTALCPKPLLRFPILSTLGVWAGMSAAALLFPSSDAITHSYFLYAIAIQVLFSAIFSVPVALAARLIAQHTNFAGRLCWLVLSVLVAAGPVTLALTPPLVARRIARDDQLAALRFLALKSAVEQATDVCDGQALERHYSGPAFSQLDWQRMTGNYVRQDGYFFMVYCREIGGRGYTIHAMPSQPVGYGSREFCTDESRRVGCGMKPNGSRNACIPCPAS